MMDGWLKQKCNTYTNLVGTRMLSQLAIHFPTDLYLYRERERERESFYIVHAFAGYIAAALAFPGALVRERPENEQPGLQE